MLGVRVGERMRHAVVLRSGAEVHDVVQLDSCTLFKFPEWVYALFHNALLSLFVVEQGAVIPVQEAVRVC